MNLHALVHATEALMLLDFAGTQTEMVIALRGRRSQRAFTRALGLPEQKIHLLESCTAVMKWAEFVDMAARSQRDVGGFLRRYFGYAGRPTSAAALIKAVAGNREAGELARECGVSRYKISRWRSGKTEPTFVDMLRILNLKSMAVLEFLEAVAKPRTLPSLADVFARRDAERQLYESYPEASVLVRMLETTSYAATRRHDDLVLARALKIPVARVRTVLKLLSDARAIEMHGAHWRPNTKHLYFDEQAAVPALRYWVGREVRFMDEHLYRGATSKLGVKHASMSDATFQKAMQLYYRFYADLGQLVIDDTTRPEKVFVMNFHFMDVTELPPAR